MARFDVEGEPYSATLMTVPAEKEDGCTYAKGFVRPPFFNADELIEGVRLGGVEVGQYATTQSCTVLLFDVPENSDRVMGDSHEIRVELALRSLTNIVDRLNEIENGSLAFGEG